MAKPEKPSKESMKKPKGKAKIKKVLGEFKHGELHSGSKKGPIVKSKPQALAIAISESVKSKKKP